MIHPNEYFDHIYCISLDRRPDRWQSVEARFRKWGLIVERRRAVDGQELFAADAVKSRVGAHLSAGAFGCLLSHCQTIEDAIQRGFRRILVLEDDVCFHRQFLDRFQEIKSIPNDWNLLYLGCSQYEWRRLKAITPNCYRARKTLGTFAYAMDHQLFKTFLETGKSILRPVDEIMSLLQAIPQYNCLAWNPPLMIADVRDSDIRNTRDQVQHAARLRWMLDLYEITDELVADDLPQCRFREPLVETTDEFRCRHPHVRSFDSRVNLEVCANCQLHSDIVEELIAVSDLRGARSDV